jgi:multiple sugar transport system substrate-binding protein
VIKNGRTLVPLRFITEAMGAALGWEAATKTANIALGDNKIALTIGKTVAKVNGYDVALDAAAAIINGKTVVPVRFVAESMGATTAWDAALKKVTVQFSMDWLKNKAIVPFWEAMAAKLGESLTELTKEFNATHPSMEVQLVQMANYNTSHRRMRIGQPSTPPGSTSARLTAISMVPTVCRRPRSRTSSRRCGIRRNWLTVNAT